MNAFDKIIGYDKIKAELMQISDMLHHPEDYAALGVKLPSGLLLKGEPGLGKTLMATVLIEDSGLPSFTVRRCRSAENFLTILESTFHEAAEAAPSIVLLDDMDKFPDNDYSDTEFAAVQGCIDTVRDKNVFVIATVNNDNNIPDSLLRCGRFDRHITVRHPSCRDGEQIIRHYLVGKTAKIDMELTDLVQMLSHSSCAELESVLNEAASYAAYARHDRISREHIIKAVLSVIHHASSDISDTDRTDQAYAAIHEAGHVAMMELLKPGSVAFVTLCCQRPEHCCGFAYRSLDLTDDAQLLTDLAGKAAFELHYGRLAPGCSSDMGRAVVSLRRRTESLGGSGILGLDVSGRSKCSEVVRSEQETIVRAELERSLFEAKELLASHRELVQELADALLEKHTLLHSDIQAICSKYIAAPAA